MGIIDVSGIWNADISGMQKHIYFEQNTHRRDISYLTQRRNIQTFHERKDIERRTGSEKTVGPQKEPFAETAKGDFKASPNRGNGYINHRLIELLTYSVSCVPTSA